MKTSCSVKNKPLTDAMESGQVKKLFEEFIVELRQGIKDDLKEGTNDKLINIQNKIKNKLSNNTKDTSESDKYMTTRKYAEKHFSDAPVMKEIDPSKLEYDENENIKYVETMIYYHNHGKLAEFLGKIIKEEYLNNNPKNQTIWCADVARLKFIIKDQDNWIIDKDNEKIKNLVIDKLLTNINNKLKNYIKICSSRTTTKNIETEYKYDLLTNMHHATDIMTEIADNMPKKILKIIAPMFIVEKL
jgi:hypothetical protein